MIDGNYLIVSNVFDYTQASSTYSAEKNKWLHIPLYTLAGAVAVSRVHDNKHWASDIILGSLIGYATTKAVLKANTLQAPSKYLIKSKF